MEEGYYVSYDKPAGVLSRPSFGVFPSSIVPTTDWDQPYPKILTIQCKVT